MANNEVSDQLAQSIKAAEPERLETTAKESTDEDSFADLLQDIVDGNVNVDEVDSRIVALLNDLLNIPILPEFMEGKILGLAVDAVKTALIQVTKRFG